MPSHNWCSSSHSCSPPTFINAFIYFISFIPWRYYSHFFIDEGTEAQTSLMPVLGFKCRWGLRLNSGWPSIADLKSFIPVTVAFREMYYIKVQGREIIHYGNTICVYSGRIPCNLLRPVYSSGIPSFYSRRNFLYPFELPVSIFIKQVFKDIKNLILGTHFFF